jgi:hypothetical protein
MARRLLIFVRKFKKAKTRAGWFLSDAFFPFAFLATEFLVLGVKGLSDCFRGDHSVLPRQNSAHLYEQGAHAERGLLLWVIELPKIRVQVYSISR